METRGQCCAYVGAQCENCKAKDAARKEKRKIYSKRASIANKIRDEAMRSLGLVKVRGAVSGKTYWE